MKDQKLLIICQGIQGSGKSTFAKKWALEDPEKRVRWNNDDFRNMCGKYWVTKRESFISVMRYQFLEFAMKSNYDIVVDDMNLNPKYTHVYEELANKYNYKVVYKKFNVPLEECIERDSKREHPIGRDIITATYEKYKDYLNEETC